MCMNRYIRNIFMLSLVILLDFCTQEANKFFSLPDKHLLLSLCYECFDKCVLRGPIVHRLAGYFKFMTYAG